MVTAEHMDRDELYYFLHLNLNFDPINSSSCYDGAFKPETELYSFVVVECEMCWS